MDDFSKTNEFLSFLYDLYEAEYFPKEEDIIKARTKIPFIKKTINKRKEDLYEKAMFRCDLIRRNIPTFDILFDFGTFIRSIEKSFMYKNDINNTVYCDTPMNVKNKRLIIFNLNQIIISISLQRDYENQKIDLTIKRTYGRKLINQFIIHNQDIVYNDCDDLILINMINYTLQNIIADIFEQYIKCIYNHELLDFNNYTFFNPNITE